LCHPPERGVLDARALDEVHVQAPVSALGEQQAPGRAAVAAGAPGLLVVGLERARDRGVAHRSHVGLVDPIPNALVATITSASPDMNRSWAREREARSRPAW